MTTLITLACLVGCLLMLINQIRLTSIINAEIIPAINRCDQDLELLEGQIADHLFPSAERSGA